MDLGYKYVEHFVLGIINEYIDFNVVEEDNNYKDILLRKCQQTMQINPEYELVSTTGPAHKKVFTSIAVVNGKKYASGTGNTKKESEQVASKNTLEILEIN
jgi:ribonuclease-3